MGHSRGQGRGRERQVGDRGAASQGPPPSFEVCREVQGGEGRGPVGFGHRMRTELPEDGLDWRGSRCLVNGLGEVGHPAWGGADEGRPRVEQRPSSSRKNKDRY